MIRYIAYIFQSLILLFLTPLFIGILKRMKAFIRGYSGAPLMQPYYDLKKLLGKGRVVSKTSSFVTQMAPLLSLTAAITAMMLVPVFYNGINDIIGNLFIIFFILGIVKFFYSLLGLDCASTFGGMGSSRELFISMLAEPIMFIVVAYLYIETKSFNIFRVSAVNTLGANYGIEHLIAAMTFAVLIIAENSRIPVDNPETHLELTMIHEAMILDLSGRDLAAVELASWVKLITFITILINCFFPIGLTMSLTITAIIKAIAFFFGKMIICLFVIAVVETTMAKSRLFRITEILSMAFSMGIVAIVMYYFM